MGTKINTEGKKINKIPSEAVCQPDGTISWHGAIIGFWGETLRDAGKARTEYEHRKEIYRILKSHLTALVFGEMSRRDINAIHSILKKYKK